MQNLIVTKQYRLVKKNILNILDDSYIIFEYKSLPILKYYKNIDINVVKKLRQKYLTVNFVESTNRQINWGYSKIIVEDTTDKKLYEFGISGTCSLKNNFEMFSVYKIKWQNINFNQLRCVVIEFIENETKNNITNYIKTKGGNLKNLKNNEINKILKNSFNEVSLKKLGLTIENIQVYNIVKNEIKEKRDESK